MSEKWDDLQELHRKWKRCTACGLHEHRKSTVFGAGSSEPLIVIIGEAPGEYEDRDGSPFVGPSGVLLDELLDHANVSTHEVYYLNLVLCRPPENRDPLASEIAACRERVDAQLRILDPPMILSLGRVAAQTLTATRTLSILKQRGQIYECTFGGVEFPYTIPVMLAVHPAALLRNPDDTRGGVLRNTKKDIVNAFEIVDTARQLWSGTPIINRRTGDPYE